MRASFISAAATMLLTLVACGGDNGGEAAPEAPTSSTPETQAVTVILRDTGGLDALFNGDGGKCLSTDPLAGMFGEEESEPIRVTLRDADGSIVGTQELPERGGSFSRADGCEWSVDFEDVPSSDFYEAAVEGPTVSEMGTAKAGEPVRIAF